VSPVLCALPAVLLPLALVLVPAPVGAQQPPAVVAREYRAPSVSAKDGSPLTIALAEKYRADLDPNRQAASGRIALLTHGSNFSGLAGFDVQVPGVPLAQSYSIMDQLALRGYDVWTMDYQNYGRSDRHDCGLCVTTEAAARDVAAAVRFILAERRVRRLHLLGWSWGGETAGLFAQSHPEAVNRLVLTAPLLDVAQGALPTADFRPNGPGLAVIFHPDARVPEVVSAFLETVVVTDPLAPTGVVLDARTDPLKMDPRRLTMPTLVLWGADDVVTPLAGPNVRPYFERLAAAEKRFVVVPEAGHAFFMERQRGVWLQEVLAHLEPGNTSTAQLPRTGARPWPVIPTALLGLALLACSTLLRRLQTGARTA
jgi:pimeloyl-ACP methyl ester carboxylesterase